MKSSLRSSTGHRAAFELRAVPGLRAATALLLAALLAACGGDGTPAASESMVQDSAGVRVVTHVGPGTWDEDESWTLGEGLRIGSETRGPEYQFGTISGIDAFADGRIVLYDSEARRVSLFDAEGEFLHSFGRDGEGPGEFSAFASTPPGGLLVDSEGRIAVPDLGNQRLTRFTDAGEVDLATPLRPEDGFSILWARSPDRDLYVQVFQAPTPGQAIDGSARLARHGPEGRDTDWSLELPANEAATGGAGGMPQIEVFAAQPLWTALSDGRIAVTNSVDYSVAIHGTGGEVETILRRQVESRPVTEAQADAILSAFSANLEEAGLPQAAMDQFMGSVQFAEQWPAIQRLMAGPDGTIWVQPVEPESIDLLDLEPESIMGNDLPGSVWDVFAEDGSYLGRVHQPERFTPHRFMGDHLYGVHRDEMELQGVMRLPLVRGSASP